jgi:peptidoglycan/xylan/chitin deacetylase (PgdA/CDA1 family)
MPRISHRASAPRRVLRRLGRRRRQRAVILLYHRVAAPARDPAGLCVSPQRFAEQLEVLRRHFEPWPLRRLVGGDARWPRRRRPVVVTFDDGYADNLYAARPLLERFDVPATVFVTTGPVDSRRETWWDELERVCFEASSLPDPWPAALGPPPPTPSGEADAAARARLYEACRARLRELPPAERDAALGALRRETGVPDAPRGSHRLLLPEELGALAEGGLVELGGHTVNHPVLARLPAAAQREEIRGGRERLAALSGHPVTSFAYPFGEADDYDGQTAALVAEAGFERACTVEPGAVEPGGDRYRLPRRAVRDWDGEKLLRRLKRWMVD